MTVVKLAFIGGTGPEGKGLAYRFALAGHEVVVGSRSKERAEDAAKEIAVRAPGATVRGAENAGAAREADVIVVTVPFSAQADTLPLLAGVVGGKIVISTAVPLVVRDGQPSMLSVAEGSAAAQAQALMPGAKVIGAFHNLSAAKLWAGEPLDQDVIICGDDADAKGCVMALAEEVRGVRGVDGGALAASRYVEGITVLLVGINRRHKATTGVRIVGLP